VSRIRLPIRFQHAGRPVRGETLHCDAGADVLVLTSCSAQLGIELRSAYVGAGEERGEVLVAEGAVIGGRKPDLRSRWLQSAADALVDQRRHFLYDHLQQLQDLADTAGFELGFEGVDVAAAQLDPDPRSSSLAR
jgi:hypothetical protein